MAHDDFYETERKFLVKHLPGGYADYPYKEISQSYLSSPGVPPVLRVRRYGDELLLTIKKRPVEDSPTCHEVEIPIGKEYFDQLRLMAGDNHIEKTRYFIPWQGYTIELDVFRGGLAGLVLAEIEYDSPEPDTDHPLPDWFGREVTGDRRYSNNSLSLRGAPQEDEER